MQALLPILGFLSQWLRARPWFAEWMLFTAALLAGLMVMAKENPALLNGPAAAAVAPFLSWLYDMVVALGGYMTSFLGGTFVASQASHIEGSPVPKYNSEAPKGTPGSPGTPENTAKEEYK